MDTQSAASFTELRRILAEFPGPDLDSATRAAEREGQLTKPTGALARLEEIAGWLATWQGRHPAAVNHPRVAVFAANTLKSTRPTVVVIGHGHGSVYGSATP